VVELEANRPKERWPAFVIRHRLALVITAHILIFALALLSAFLLAYNFRWTAPRQDYRFSWFWEFYLPLLVLALPIKTLVFLVVQQYRGSWRYVGLRDLLGVISASLIGAFVFLSVYFILEKTWETRFGHPLIDRFRDMRQSSVFLLDWAATIAFVCAARILVRFYHEEIQPHRPVEAKRVLICGAGDAGETVLRELLRLRREAYECVGLLDDDVPELFGRIHDVEIIGRTHEIREICERYGVEEVLIALPHASPRTIRALVERCEGTGVRFRTIPAMSDVIEGRVQVSQIRDVDIADLLGRQAVQLEVERVADELRAKRVLVTGAGGSIGSEMCRQIASFGPERLILLERAENNLFEIDRELRGRFPGLDVVPCVADISDQSRLNAIFEREKPVVVFHAAAHKHVPMMEINPGEAIKNNIAGTAAVANATLDVAALKMVMISTDKAVNPTSIMGCTKRVAEMYIQSLSGRGVTQFVTVRFGNVLGSSGSVVPIFKKQIAEGGPVTVTHPDMTRYFMTITEAAQLVLQAGVMGKGGEIYVLHMGEPVRIVDLARDMITLSGLRPGIDIEVVFTGKRPGEKLYEELSNEGEHIGDTAHPKIGIWKHRPADFDGIRRGIERLTAMADTCDADQVRAELKRIVPEYDPANGADGPVLETIDVPQRPATPVAHGH
jgi:FlaA1/EpsC-like NDP-sugar epimerase